MFWYAQHAVTNPVGPIYDKETGSLKPRCVAALTRVYVLSTRDTDFILNEAGLNNIQVTSYSLVVCSSLCCFYKAAKLQKYNRLNAAMNH